MKLFHLSDLHLGKRVNGFSMLEDQRHILTEILALLEEEQPDAVLISGDIYDRSVPSVEAVELFDDLLWSLALREVQVFVLSGNHDSPERLAFGGRLMEQRGIHLSPVFAGKPEPRSLQDAFGPVHFYLLPFVKPAQVRACFPEANIESYADAVAAALEGLPLEKNARNVLLCHQFVTGAERCESEEKSVGGSDNVDAAVFAGFDYVALGHLHGPQNIGSERVRYCGSPLAYSFSELGHKKSVTVVELGEKGNVSVRTLPLIPKRKMLALRGSYEELTLRSFYAGSDYPESYLSITLTDENDVPEAMGKLRTVYPYLMKLEYDNARTRHETVLPGDNDVAELSPGELFAAFYAAQNGQDMSEEQADFVRRLMEEIREETI